MRDFGLVLSVLGAMLAIGGRFDAWAYGKSVGDWGRRAFRGMSKFGLVLLPIGLVLLALSLVV
jgi:hypothetical protein